MWCSKLWLCRVVNVHFITIRASSPNWLLGWQLTLRSDKQPGSSWKPWVWEASVSMMKSCLLTLPAWSENFDIRAFQQRGSQNSPLVVVSPQVGVRTTWPEKTSLSMWVSTILCTVGQKNYRKKACIVKVGVSTAWGNGVVEASNTWGGDTCACMCLRTHMPQIFWKGLWGFGGFLVFFFFFNIYGGKKVLVWW